MNMNAGSQNEYSDEQFQAHIKIVVAHIIEALRNEKQEDDYTVELTVFSSEARDEHEGPCAVVRMPNGMPPDKAAWPMVMGFIGKQYRSSGSPKAAAVCLVTHAYYRDISAQAPAANPLPDDINGASLASSINDWLNAGTPDIADDAGDIEKQAQEDAKSHANQVIDSMSPEELEALPRTEVIMVQAATFDGREATAIIHFSRDIDNCIVPEDEDDVRIAEMKNRNEDWGDGLFTAFFKVAANNRSNGFKSSIDPFK